MRLSPPHFRFFAFLIDFLGFQLVKIVGSYVGAFMATLVWSVRGESEGALVQAAEMGLSFGATFWTIAFFFLNYGVLQGLTGASFGKKVLGLQVLREDGRPFGIAYSLFRTACVFFSVVPFYLGFAMIFWSKKNRCLHDVICGTLVASPPVNAANGPTLRLLKPQTEAVRNSKDAA